MKAVFADTFYWIALSNPAETRYRDALALDAKMAGLNYRKIAASARIKNLRATPSCMLSSSMNRRDFLATSAASFALFQQPASTEGINASTRRIYPMNRDWLFGARNAPDSALTKVTLPHSNVTLPWHSFDDRAYEFISLYRRSACRNPPKASACLSISKAP